MEECYAVVSGWGCDVGQSGCDWMEMNRLVLCASVKVIKRL